MKITFTNRLSVLLRERQISSASEFGRRMTAEGFPMSSSHASRYEKDTAPAFDLKFINTACNVLQCLPNDLYNITIELDEDEADPMWALPRHAVVIRTKPGSEAAPSSALVQTVVVETPPVSRKAPQKSSEKAARQTPARSATTDEETGPSGILFPYIKKN